MNVSPDLTLVMNEARKLSIQFRHGFIDYTHLFVAALTIDSEAWAYGNDIDTRTWKGWLQYEYPAAGKHTLNDEVPLTVFAERIIRHAYMFVHANGDASICSVHILLALMCVKCKLTEALNKQGTIFETISERYYGKPIKRMLPSIHVLQKGPYSRWKKFFMNGRSKKKKAEDFYRQAYDLYLYELYDDSLLVCAAGLSLEPDNVDLRKLQLYCFVGTRDFQAALPLALQLANNDTKIIGFKFTLGYIYDELSHYEEAAGIYDGILAKYPEEKTTLNNRGFNLSRQAMYAEAIPYYEKSISVDPEFAYAWNNLGFAKYKLGKIDEALDCINRSLELDKGNSYAYKNKGIIYLGENAKEKALQNFQLALKYGYTKKYGNEVLELLKNIN